VPRAAFTPEEVVSLTINFYRRNYIEGLFLSSGIERSPDYTMQQLIAVIKKLRTQEGFNGYIHLKGIPGADEALVHEAGLYADRMSYNLELPTTRGLRLLAPEKERKRIIVPMQQVRDQTLAYRDMKKHVPSTPSFIPAGQSTQMIVGATDETDYHIIKIAEAMYDRLSLKRVYYSAFVPGSTHPAVMDRGRPPLNREHRIYQADWLLRFYGFKADEILTPEQPELDLLIDPKCQWALNHMAYFPMEVNRVSYAALLRIPGIGVTSARRIVNARRFAALSFEDLKGMGVVLKRAKYFITCKGQYQGEGDIEPVYLRRKLLEPPKPEQLSLFQTYPEVFDESEATIRGLLT
jgi:putative DNA modification/repair radical SAM protein